MTSTFTPSLDDTFVVGEMLPSVELCAADNTQNVAVRCCADVASATQDHITCDPFASEEGGCTSSRSCEQLASSGGWPSSNGDTKVCGESDILGSTVAGADPSGCNAEATFETARDICLGAGARLCTVEELEADETAGTGCGFDNSLSWSIDDVGCPSGSHVTVIGRSTANADQTSACATDDSTAAVRCCADVEVTTPCTATSSTGTTTTPPGPPPGPPLGCISERSCEDLANTYGGWPTTGYDPGVCGESDNGFATGAGAACFGDDDTQIDGWQAAQAICYEVGARLCTMDEMAYHVGWNTGCGHNAAAVWSADTCVNGHLTTRFPNTSTWDVEEVCEQDTASKAVRCCADTEATMINKSPCDAYATQVHGCTSAQSCSELTFDNSHGDPAVCGESDMGGQCNQETSWSTAQSLCIGAGARLCTVEEIEADETAGSGCGHDGRYIWTADTIGCNPGEHVVVIGNSGFNVDESVLCQADDLHTGTGVRCCADAITDPTNICALATPPNPFGR